MHDTASRGGAVTAGQDGAGYRGGGVTGELELREQFMLARRRLGVTQAEVAARTGRTQQTIISAWERGRRDLPDDLVRQLVQVLDEIAQEQPDSETAA